MYLARMTSPSSSSTPKWDASVWGLMAVLCGVLFLDGLDVSMVGMALPSIESDLGLTTSQLQWIVSGYVLGYGGFLLLGGRSADLLGRRRMLLIALAVFTVASAVGGLVSDGTLLVVTRFLKGAAAAFTAPAGLSIITTKFAGGPGAQPRPEHLHRHRRERLLARPRRRRPADRARLALDVPAAGADRRRPARSRPALPAARPHRQRSTAARSTSPAR